MGDTIIMTETDRELLMFAAKAAGYKKYYSHYLGRDSFVTYDEEYYSEIKERRVVGEKTLDWNPLTDDGDALRLAVKLHICPAVDETAASAMVSLDEVSWCDLKEVSNDPYAATRRAIVRAAAEIGRNMK